MRIALIIEYDGHGLVGWQRQDNGPSVQARLEDALAQVDGRAVKTVACGRTDADVHAEAQVVHADVDVARASRSLRAYSHGLNAFLPGSIRVMAARAVSDRFHARFACIERAYRYQMWNREVAPALQRWRHWWLPRPMDVDGMRAAAAHLLGKQDFSSFRSSGCSASTPVRDVRRIDIESHGCVIAVNIRADAFVYHMVRNIVGALAWVGLGKWQPDMLAQLLEARDRRQVTAPMAPGHGLYFTDAVYPEFAAQQVLAGMDRRRLSAEP